MKETSAVGEAADDAGLPITYRGTVYPWHLDHVGHMNVRHYVGMFDQATWALVGLVGMTPSYPRDNDLGMAALEQHIWYYRELHAGDLVAVRSGILEVREKVIRFFHEMVNVETGETAARTEVTGVHMDAKARRSRPLPKDVRARATALIQAGGAAASAGTVGA